MIDPTAPLYATLPKEEFERVSQSGGSIRTVLLTLTPSMGQAEADAAKLAAAHPQKRAVVIKLDAASVLRDHGDLIEHAMRHFLTRAWVQLSGLLVGWYEIGEHLIEEIETGYA